MDRVQRDELGRKHSPQQFSVSAIGSPAAFSTAVKLPGSPSNRGQNDESPFTSSGQLAHEHSPQPSGASITGRLSLNSTPSDRDYAPSLDNTSVGILDLDAMQDSSMHRFLTSPFDSQDLNLHMSSTMSVPSTQVTGHAPTLRNTNENPPVDVLTSQSIGLPQELLLRQSEDTVYSSDDSSGSGSETSGPFASQASSQADDEDNALAIAEAVKGGLDDLELTSSSLQSSFGEEHSEHELSPPPVSTSSTSNQNAAVSGSVLFARPPRTEDSGFLAFTMDSHLSSSPVVHQDMAGSSFYRSSGHLEQEDKDSPLKLQDLSLGGGGRRGDMDMNDGVGNADLTLINDEMEPSVMREADEFSRFDPSHLASLLEKDGLGASLKPRQNGSNAKSSAASAAVTSRLRSSLPPLNNPVSKIVASTRMSSVTTNTKLSASLPAFVDKKTKSDKDAAPLTRKEGMKAEGDVSSRTESALSFATSNYSVLSGEGSPSNIMEGLPSAYLAPTSFLTDATDQSSLESSALCSLNHSPAPPHHREAPPPHDEDPLPPTFSSDTGANIAQSASNSHTSVLSTSSLPSSLTELAGALGSEPPQTVATVTPTGTTTVDGRSGGGEKMSARGSSGIYNPFDSDDNASVQSFGQMEFGDFSSDSFMAQLAKDEQEIQATQLTPSTQQMQSFTSVLSTTHFSNSLGDELSMDAYFQQKSGKMGQLSATKLPPSERPHFSDATGHLIESPLVSDLSSSVTPSFDHVTSTAPPTHAIELIPESGPLDSTLVASESADVGKGHAPQFSTDFIAASTLKGSKIEDLTPLVTDHSPFPAQFDIPKLDFANASSTSQHVSPKSVLLSSSPLLQKSGTPASLPPEFLQPALVEDSSTSTLILREVSALSLSSPPFVLDPSLRSMPTPSMAKLPGFDVTEMTSQQFSSFSSSRDVDTSDLGLDQSPSQPSPVKADLGHNVRVSSPPSKVETTVASSADCSRNHSSSSPVASSSPSKTSGTHIHDPSVGNLVQTSPLKVFSVSPSVDEKSPKLPSSQHSHSSPTQLTVDQHRSINKSMPSTSRSKKPSPSKVTFSPKVASTSSSGSHHVRHSPAKFQMEQKLSTETLPTWSTGSPLSSPPKPSFLHQGNFSSPPKSTSIHLTRTPSKEPGSTVSEGGSSPKTEAARNKLASLQAQLDAACFNAEEFLSMLKSGGAQPTTPTTTPTAAAVTATTGDSTKASAQSKVLKVEESPIPVSIPNATSPLVAKLSPAKIRKSTKGDGKSHAPTPDVITEEVSTSTTNRLSAKLSTTTPPCSSSKTTPPPSTRGRSSGGRIMDAKKKSSLIPRPTKPFMTTPTTSSATKKKAQLAKTSTTTGSRASDRHVVSPGRENNKRPQQTSVKKLPSPKKSKSSLSKDEIDSGKVKQHNIHLPSSSSSMRSPFVVNNVHVSETAALSSGFTLSSLLTSNAQHTSMSVSPPSQSTLTDSTPSTSPSPQKRSPTRTAPSSSPLRKSTPPTSLSCQARSPTLHLVPSTSSDISHSTLSPGAGLSTHLSASHSHAVYSSAVTSSIATTNAGTALSKPSLLSDPAYAPTSTDGMQLSTSEHHSSDTTPPHVHLITTTGSPHPSLGPQSSATLSSSSKTPLVVSKTSPSRSLKPHPSSPHPPSLHPSSLSTATHAPLVPSTASPSRSLKPHSSSGSVDPTVLQVPDSLHFDKICCVGVSMGGHLVVANLGERWLQLEFKISHLYRDGAEVSVSGNTFALPQRSFIGPEQQENVKVVFSPSLPGNYEALVAVHAHLVVSSPVDSNKPLANVILKGVAEEPGLEVQTTSSIIGDVRSDRVGGAMGALSTPALDYGVVVGGNSTTLQLKLANRGLAALPLSLTINAKSALSQLYFSFGEAPHTLESTSSPSSLVSSHLLHPRRHTLTLTLPPRPPEGRGDLDWYGIDVHFHAPKRYIDDSVVDPGPPDEISAQLSISINGLNPATTQLTSIPLQAIVGIARLHVPRSLQSVSLSCYAGQVMSRRVPFKNAGNIPLRVKLKVSGSQSKVFTVSPDFLLMEPGEESQVNVLFSPASPLTSDGVLMIHIEPNGPNYELKLSGVATPTATPTSTSDVLPGSEPVRSVAVEDGILSCNKRVLFWGGVQLSSSVCQEVVLHNSHSVAIPLSLSIRHPNSPFKLRSVGGSDDCARNLNERKVELLPGRQVPVGVVYTPSSATVSLSALDITDLLHSKKYRIRLCGYGGSSHVEVVGGRGASGDYHVNLGEIATGVRVKTKMSVYNSGLRAAFVSAICTDGDTSASLPTDHVSVTPSKFIIPPQQMRELLLVYHINEKDEARCSSHPSTPIAYLKLTSGDEVMRQRLQRVITRRLTVSTGGHHQELTDNGRGFTWKNASNRSLLARFPEQDTVPTDPDFSSYDLEDEEGIFEERLTTITVSLLASPSPSSSSTKQPHSTVFTISPPPHSATARLKHKLSLSNTPPVQRGVVTPPVQKGMVADPTALEQSFTRDILKAYTHLLPDAQVGHYSERALDIHNPYSTDLRWELTSSGSPFVRRIANNGIEGRRSQRAERSVSSKGGEIFKANYSVFWMSERRGTTPPRSTSKVPVLFQPHDKGSFSQIWDLKVSCDDIGTKRLRISIGGKAVASPLLERQTVQADSQNVAPTSRDQMPRSHDRTEQVTQWLSQTQRHFEAQSDGTSKTTPLKKTVYIKDERVVFPPTNVGSKSTVKVRVCNRGVHKYKFDVIKPMVPFSTDHHTFELGSRQCARLPVHFSPASPGEYTGVLAVRTNAGHQTFAELRGTALS